MDSPEYKTLNDCYPQLVSSIEQSPSDVAVQLRPLAILAPADVSYLNDPQNGDNKKARKIVDALIKQVRNKPQKFHKFVKALIGAGAWTNAIVATLEEKLAEILFIQEKRSTHSEVTSTSHLENSVSTDIIVGLNLPYQYPQNLLGPKQNVSICCTHHNWGP